MANPFDQFDAAAPQGGNPFDQFDAPTAPDRGALEAGANQWANQTLGGFGPQVGGVIQGLLDATGLDQHRGGVDRAAPGAQQPQTVNELAAALETGKPRPTPSIGSFSGGLNRFVDQANQNLDTEAVQHPVASAVGGIGGGLTLASMIPGAAIARGLGIAGKAGTIAAKIGEGFAGGLTYGAISGTGNARGGAADRVRGGLEGALTGGVTGVAAPYVAASVGAGARAAGKAVARPFQVARGYTDVGKEAARRVTGALAADLGNPSRAVTGMEQAQRAGLPVITADMGETTRALARSAANTSPEGRAVLDQALAARQAGQIDRMTSIIEQSAPGVNAPATRAFLETAATRANSPAYKKAYLEGDRPLWSPVLEQLTGSPAVVDAMKAAATKGKDRAITEGFGAFNPGVKVTQDGQVIFGRSKGGVPTYPNLQFWDYTKRELDDAAKALDRAGRNGEAGVTRDLAKKLRTELDRHVPSYADARSTAASFFGAENASEAGSNFVTQRGDKMQPAIVALAKMKPAEKALFAEGFATSLIGRVREAGNRSSVVDSIFVKSPAARQRIEIALGRGAADKMEAFLRVENLMDLTKRAMGNSTTARQLTELGLAGGVGAVSTGGNLSDPATIMHAAMAYGVLHGGKAALRRIDMNVAREVAKLLASQDPKVVKQAIDRIGRSPGLSNALRIGEGHFSRVLVPLVGNRGGGSSAPVANAQENQGN